MKHSKINEALRNSFAAVKRDINEIKARNSLIDIKLKNSFSNIKKDMGYLKKAVEEVKARREKFIEEDYLNERLSKIDSAIENIKNDYTKKLEKDSLKDFDLDSIKSQLKTLDEARIKNGYNFEKAIDSLKEELDIDSKLKELESKISKPVIKEVVIEKPVIKEVVKEKKAKSPKKKKEKGMFTKMIDFFAED